MPWGSTKVEVEGSMHLFFIGYCGHVNYLVVVFM